MVVQKTQLVPATYNASLTRSLESECFKEHIEDDHILLERKQVKKDIWRLLSVTRDI